RLHKRVMGQEEAVKAVSDAVRLARAGLREGRRPIATFLFLGPTGVGKTELAKALAETVFGDEDALIRLDMSEYMERHA
ncbi:AAA family ATPase, partial [Escherichia coli]|uniref:AAA family ATPase n=1 Tax=Escherichia coli TaxID=562 RepID=UPI00193301EE